jgi:hypothetical protein
VKIFQQRFADETLQVSCFDKGGSSMGFADEEILVKYMISEKWFQQRFAEDDVKVRINIVMISIPALLMLKKVFMSDVLACSKFVFPQQRSCGGRVRSRPNDPRVEM